MRIEGCDWVQVPVIHNYSTNPESMCFFSWYKYCNRSTRSTKRNSHNTTILACVVSLKTLTYSTISNLDRNMYKQLLKTFLVPDYPQTLIIVHFGWCNISTAVDCRRGVDEFWQERTICFGILFLKVQVRDFGTWSLGHSLSDGFKTWNSGLCTWSSLYILFISYT